MAYLSTISSCGMLFGYRTSLIYSCYHRSYFPTFDNQRAGLIDVYDDASYFSYSVNATIPIRARIQGLHYKMANNKKLVWNNWFTAVEGGSRNLNRLQGGEMTHRSLHTGPQAIMETLCKLPGTRHDMASTSEKFCIDAFPVKHGTSMALMLVVHGEFTEGEAGYPGNIRLHANTCRQSDQRAFVLLIGRSCWRQPLMARGTFPALEAGERVEF